MLLPQTPAISTWLLNVGASHHVTTDLESLSLNLPYIESDDILIVDTKAFWITPTPLLSFLPLILSFIQYSLRTQHEKKLDYRFKFC